MNRSWCDEEAPIDILIEIHRKAMEQLQTMDKKIEKNSYSYSYSCKKKKDRRIKKQKTETDY